MKKSLIEKFIFCSVYGLVGEDTSEWLLLIGKHYNGRI